MSKWKRDCDRPTFCINTTPGEHSLLNKELKWWFRGTEHYDGLVLLNCDHNFFFFFRGIGFQDHQPGKLIEQIVSITGQQKTHLVL